MSEIEIAITVFMFAFAGLTFIVIGELCGNKVLNSGHDVEYDKPDEPQSPPIPPNVRSFGNEAPPRELRKPPKTEPTQSSHDLLWLWIYTQNMEHDAMLEENVDEFKRGYTEAMEDVRWGIEFIDKFNNEGQVDDEPI